MSSKDPYELVLSIESSCDETSLCLMLIPDGDFKNDFEFINKIKVLASVISSQIDIHEKYGGVIPEIGARQHADQIHFIFEQLIQQLDAEYRQDILLKINRIAVTTHPGLVSALRVGQEFAKSIRFFAMEQMKLKNPAIQEIPIQEVNHLRGHMASSFFS